MKNKLLLFDLDGTLLNSNKKISSKNMKSIKLARERGYYIGVATSRSEQNCLFYLDDLVPDVLITSGGALVKILDDLVYKVVFSVDELNTIIKTIKYIFGNECEITVDTIDKHYWNYKTDPSLNDNTWGSSIYHDFNEFDEEALKICVEIFEDEKAKLLKNSILDCDFAKFSDGYWYKLTKKDVNKDKAVDVVCESLRITVNDIIAFGDDYVDIGMLKKVKKGITMGNATDEVKKIADKIIGSNDEDSIAIYLESIL